MEDVMIALGMDPNEVDVEGIKRKIDMPLEQIKKLARQRPEVVAMLLKSWVMDERK
jgi:flagellar biosynthesis/type III secretory pathway M-ring protein FliF/YscJ